VLCLEDVDLRENVEITQFVGSHVMPYWHSLNDVYRNRFDVKESG
jgi:hypothetical protein